MHFASSEQLAQGGEARGAAFLSVQNAQQVGRAQAGHRAIGRGNDDDVGGAHVDGILRLASMQHHLGAPIP